MSRADAQTTFTWDGGGANASNNTPANWVGDTYVNNSGNFYVFSDGAVRNAVAGSAAQNGQLAFGGDAFTVDLTTTWDLNPSVAGFSIVMDSNNLMTFSGTGQLTMRKGVSGTGTGIINVTSNLAFTSNSYTWGGDGTFLMNDADGTNLTGGNRLMTINGQQKVIVNNTSGSGLGLFGVSVATGAALGGSGILTPGDATNANITIQSNGTLSAGDNYTSGADVGTLTTTFGNTLGTMILSSGSKYVFDLATTSTSDKIVLTNGTLQLNGQQFSDFTFNNLAGFGVGTYTLFQTAAITNSLGANLTGTIGGLGSTLSVSGNDVLLTVVPEPTTWALLAFGLCTMLFLRRRRVPPLAVEVF